MQIKHPKSVKLGLLGTTGVGKDTCVKIIQKHYSDLRIKLIRLAAPLYEVQSFIYKICQREKDSNIQDGVLLNFLGKHLREINPDVLKRPFFQTLHESTSKADVIICSDVRPADVPFVKEEGFTILNIVTDSKVARQRRLERGDVSLGNPSHSTEKDAVINLSDYQISNNGSLEEFEKKVIEFMQRLIA